MKQHFEFLHSPFLRNVGHNFAWLSFERLILLFGSFFVSAWMIRYLGPSNYGLLTFAGSVVAILRALAGFGLDHIVVRELTKHPEERFKILGSAFAISLCAGLLLYVILWLSLPRIGFFWGSHILMLVIGLTLPLEAFRVFDQDFLARENARLGAKARTIANVLAIGCRASFVLTKLPVLAFGWVLVIQRSLTSVVSMIFLRSFTGLKPSKLRVDFDTSVRLVKSARFLLLESFAVMIFLRMDQLMLARMVDTREVGFFGASVRISEVLHLLPANLIATLFPAIVRLKGIRDKVKYHKRIQLLFDLFVLLAFGIGIPIFILSPQIVHLLLGEQYSPTASILRIQMVTFIFVCISSVRVRWLIAEDLLKLATFFSFSGVVLNFFLNWLFIPTLGGEGAALATLISQVFMNLVLLGVHPKTRCRFKQVLLALVAPFRVRSIFSELSTLRRPEKTL